MVVVAVEGERGDDEELTGMAGMATSDLRRLHPSCVSLTKNEFLRQKFTSAENPSMQPSSKRSIHPNSELQKSSKRPVVSSQWAILKCEILAACLPLEGVSVPANAL